MPLGEELASLSLESSSVPKRPTVAAVQGPLRDCVGALSAALGQKEDLGNAHHNDQCDICARSLATIANKSQRPGGFNHKNVVFPSPGSWESDPGVGRAGPPEVPLLT